MGVVADGGFSEHWPDLVLSALIALVAFLGRNWFSSNEKRHDRAEDKFEEIDGKIGSHDARIGKVETRADNLERGEYRRKN